MNSIFYINAYRIGTIWMFDDVDRGLKAEPFVSGASELIQKYLDRKGITSTKNVPLIFSISPMPGHDLVLTSTQKTYPMYVVSTIKKKIKGKSYSYPVYEEDLTQDPDSSWYMDQEGNECWLCPAQITFFGGVADVIYCKVG